MKVIPDTIEFEWDKGNCDKSYLKHGITCNEAEEIFTDEKLIIIPDIKHSEKEKRSIAVGRALNGKKLFVVFTFRSRKIRVISVRGIHMKEVLEYEKIKKNS